MRDGSDSESFDQTVALSIGTGGQTLQVGEIVGGAYRLESLLGQGGMGLVFRARHLTFNQDYALKIVNPDVLDAVSSRRFAIEAQAIAKLDHENIVKIFNMGVHNQTCPYYVMELMTGESLSAYIKKGVDISIEQGLDIFRQMASALGYAHRKGIVHRDVKPSNIVLLPHGDSYRAKIVDFGLAKVFYAGQQLTATGEVFGTPYYMSPEQSTGQPIDARADIYSLGCALFETITGAPPFKGATAVQTLMMQLEAPVPKFVDIFDDQALAQQFDLLIGRMMAKRLDDRYQTMEQVARDIQRLIDGKSIAKTAADMENTAGDQDYDGDESVGDSARNDDGEIESSNVPTSARVGNLAASAFAFSLIGILALLVVTSGYYIFRGQFAPKRNVDPGMLIAKLPNENDVDGTVAQKETIKKEFLAVSPIRSTLVSKAGTICKRFNFPQTCIGEIVDVHNRSFEAEGEIFVTNSPLALSLQKKIFPAAFMVPEIVSTLGVDEFEELRIQLSQFDQSDEEIPIGESGKGLVSILETAQTWRRLNSIIFANIAITSDVVSDLGKLKQLRRLKVLHSKSDWKLLSKAPFLLRLMHFSVQSPKPAKIDPLIVALAKSSALQSLSLEDVEISDATFSRLADNRSVTFMYLGKLKLSRSMLQTLVSMRNLSAVTISLCNLSDDDFIFLAKCKHINTIYVTPSGYEPGELKRLEKLIPKLKVFNGNQ